MNSPLLNNPSTMINRRWSPQGLFHPLANARWWPSRCPSLLCAAPSHLDAGKSFRLISSLAVKSPTESSLASSSGESLQGFGLTLALPSSPP